MNDGSRDCETPRSNCGSLATTEDTESTEVGSSSVGMSAIGLCVLRGWTYRSKYWNDRLEAYPTRSMMALTTPSR